MYHDKRWTTCDRCGKEIENRKGVLKAKLDKNFWCFLRFYLMKDGREYAFEKGVMTIDLCEDCANELAELIRVWMKNKTN